MKRKSVVTPMLEDSPVGSLVVIDRIINAFDAVHALSYSGDSPRRYEAVTGVSLTVPNMVLSMHEIFSRFTRGLPVPVTQGIFLEEDLSDLDSMNRFELIDLQRRLDKSARDLRESILKTMNDAKRKQQEVDFADKVDAAVKKALEEKDQSSVKS